VEKVVSGSYLLMAALLKTQMPEESIVWEDTEVFVASVSRIGTAEEE